MDVMLEGTYTDWIYCASLNALLLIEVALAGIVYEVALCPLGYLTRAVRALLKRTPPLEEKVGLSGCTLMLVNSFALSNAALPILVTPAGISTEPEQLVCVVTRLFAIVMVPDTLQSMVPDVPL
jgi:hypothetical protein